MADNIIAAGSLTKAYGLAGLRCGWILTPPPLVPLFRHAVDHIFVENVSWPNRSPPGSSRGSPPFACAIRPSIGPNHARVAAFMAGEPRLEWVEPYGGIIAFS